MRKNIQFSLLLFYAALAGATEKEVEETMRLANKIFDAGAYQKAESIYGLILELPMPSWQKEITGYNRGTALLAQYKFDEALSQFGQIHPAKTSSPLLIRDLKTNLAVAHLSFGKSILDLEEGNTKSQNEEHFFTILYHFRGAIRLGVEGLQAECALQKLEGAEMCIPSEDLLGIIREARVQLAQVLVKSQEEHLQRALPEREIPLLLSGLKGTILNLIFLQESALTLQQQKTYKKLFESQANSWVPLWEAISRNIGDPDAKELFQRANRAFRAGLVDMQEGHFPASQAQLAQAQSVLNALLQQVWKDSSLVLLLKNLSQSYQILALQSPLPLLGLRSLLEEQKQLQERTGSEQSQKFQRSTVHLGKSLEILQKGKVMLAELFLAEAEQEIKDFISAMQSKRPGSPEDILQEGVEKQRFALKANRLRQELQPAEQQEVIDMIHLRQLLVPIQGPRFLEQALIMQQEQFAQKERKNAQEKQWKEIIALVSEGYTKSMQAEKILQTPQEVQRAISLQEQVIDAWSKALAKLKDLKSTQKPLEKQSPVAPLSEQSQQKKQVIKKIFHATQEMEKNDRKLKEVLPPSKQMERPW